MIKKTDNHPEPYSMPESAILNPNGSPKEPPEPPPEPPPLPPDPPDLPLETIREDGCGSLVLLVLAAGMLGLIMGLATGCTTSFSTDDEDTWEEADTDEDTTDVADQADSGSDSLEVPEDTEDDGGGDPDAEGDTDEDTEDPCIYYPTWYRDQDMDGWGRDDLTVCFPTQPEGYVDRGGDCCDVRPEVSPGVEEWQEEPYTCPGESWDYDCDGEAERQNPDVPDFPCDTIGDDCIMYCHTFTTEEECWAHVWWEGAVPECGMSETMTKMCWWEPTMATCTAVMHTAMQRCR